MSSESHLGKRKMRAAKSDNSINSPLSGRCSSELSTALPRITGRALNIPVLWSAVIVSRYHCIKTLSLVSFDR